MCGIVGYIGPATAVPILLDGLSRLEYRGYDSAGIALANESGLDVIKVAGRVSDLRTEVHRQLGDTAPSFPVNAGIAHTRWATHGQVNDVNSHPHLDSTGRTAVVHNGIIENADALRAQLIVDGVVFRSETDTEVIAHLVRAALDSGAESLSVAVLSTLAQLQGTYGLIVLDADHPGQFIVAGYGSPIVLGVGDGETVVSSDPSAFVRHSGPVVHLEDGNVVTVYPGSYEVASVLTNDFPLTDDDLADGDASSTELGAFADFMRKEIHDQPSALRRVLGGRLDARFGTVRFGGIDMDARQLRSFKRVKVLGCGTAYYAGQLGASLIEELARIPADAEPAAEFRYRNPVVDPDTLYFAVSQSGETIDTLLAVQELQRKGCTVLGIVNVVGSAIARQTGRGIFIHAGPEYSVASTKAFTNMAAALAMVGLLLGRVRDLGEVQGERLVSGLQQLPGQIAALLEQEDEIARIAAKYVDAKSMYFIGRGRAFPIAREGAQKLKEISYIHAEAYQASELKHGPLALVNPDMPSVVLVPDDALIAKNISTIEQIRARGGRVLAVSAVDLPAGLADDTIRVPSTEPQLEPILLNIPLQLLAYYSVLGLGRDVDKPRNLAKSVTVE